MKRFTFMAESSQPPRHRVSPVARESVFQDRLETWMGDKDRPEIPPPPSPHPSTPQPGDPPGGPPTPHDPPPTKPSPTPSKPPAPK